MTCSGLLDHMKNNPPLTPDGLLWWSNLIEILEDPNEVEVDHVVTCLWSLGVSLPTINFYVLDQDYFHPWPQKAE